MITLSDNIYASLPLPGDAKNINTVLDNNNVIVETIQQYLNRVDMYSRYLGMEVPILIPEGIYEANDFVTKVNSGIITWSKYGFVEGVEDPDFIPILNGLQELPTEEYFPVTIDLGSQTILAITADQILSITLPEPPIVHDAVTIATGSQSILGLNNQELSISLPATHNPVTIATASAALASINPTTQELTIEAQGGSDPDTLTPTTTNQVSLGLHTHEVETEEATFFSLSDFDVVTYVGNELKVLRVNALGTKVELATPSGGVSDTAYDATTWDGVVDTAPSKNAVRDKIEAMLSRIEDIAFEFADIIPGTAQTYTLDIKASYGYTIEAACLEVNSGTLTGVAIKIGSTAVTSLSNLTVDTGVDETASTGAKTVIAGDRVSLVTSTGYSGTPSAIRGKLKIKRT